MVNNFIPLSRLFDKLDNENDFYFVQIIKRKKENPDSPSSSIIRSFYFYNKEEFINSESKIIELCEKNNARAYFWVNPKNSVGVAYACIDKIVDLLRQNQTRCISSVYDSVVGNTNTSRYEKLWLVDIDTKEWEFICKIKRILNECRGKDEDKVKMTLFSVNGVHLITTRFDRLQFSQKLAINNIDNLDVHKDGITLLYYNKAE